jgi:hypothetical protein
VTLVSAPLWGAFTDATQRHHVLLLLAIGGTMSFVQLHPRRDRDFEGACGVDRRADVEEAVAAQAPTLVRLDRVGHL